MHQKKPKTDILKVLDVVLTARINKKTKAPISYETHVLEVLDVVLTALRARGKGQEGVPLHSTTPDVRGHEILPGANVHLKDRKPPPQA